MARAFRGAPTATTQFGVPCFHVQQPIEVLLLVLHNPTLVGPLSPLPLSLVAPTVVHILHLQHEETGPLAVRPPHADAACNPDHLQTPDSVPLCSDSLWLDGVASGASWISPAAFLNLTSIHMWPLSTSYIIDHTLHIISCDTPRPAASGTQTHACTSMFVCWPAGWKIS